MLLKIKELKNKYKFKSSLFYSLSKKGLIKRVEINPHRFVYDEDSFLEVFSNLRRPRSKEYSIEEVRDCILRVANELLGGKIPTKKEFDILKGKLRITLNVHNFRVSRFPETTTYLDLLRILNLPLPENLNTKLYLKAQEFGIPFRSEISFRIEGKLYRIDFGFKTQEFGDVFVEIDGASHWSVNSDHHTRAQYREGLSKEESFQKKIARDAKVENYFKEKNLVLIRVEPHFFLEIRPENFLDFIKEKVLFSEKVVLQHIFLIPEIIQQEAEQLSFSKIAKKYKVSRSMVEKIAQEHGIFSKFNNKNKHILLESKKEEIIKRISSGEKVYDLAEKMGIDAACIYKNFKKELQGIKTRDLNKKIRMSVLTLFEEKKEYWEIAKILNIPEKKVYYILHRSGYTLNSKPNRVNPEDILKLRSQGYKIREIASLLKIGASSIVRILSHPEHKNKNK